MSLGASVYVPYWRNGLRSTFFAFIILEIYLCWQSNEQSEWEEIYFEIDTTSSKYTKDTQVIGVATTNILGCTYSLLSKTVCVCAYMLPLLPLLAQLAWSAWMHICDNYCCKHALCRKIVPQKLGFGISLHLHEHTASQLATSLYACTYVSVWLCLLMCVWLDGFMDIEA